MNEETLNSQIIYITDSVFLTKYNFRTHYYYKISVGNVDRYIGRHSIDMAVDSRSPDPNFFMSRSSTKAAFWNKASKN